MPYSTASSSKPSMRLPFGLLKMARYLHDNSTDINLVFSPYSIQLALSLLANGSKGSTMKELLTFLDVKDLHHLNLEAAKGIDFLTGEGANLSFVGGVWIDQSFTLNPTFKITVKEIYHTDAQVVDFENEASKIITEVNNWAAEATDGLIKSILPDVLDPMTRSLLANALHFKGTWSQQFDKLHTKNYNFYMTNGNIVNVPFLISREDQFISTFDDFQVLRLPYKRSANAKDEFSMYIILPHERNGFWPLVEKMCSEPLFLETYVHPYGEKVDVGYFILPKFKMTYEFEASKILESLGLKSTFSNEAEFHEMVYEGRLKVSKVFHKSHIKINEEGTEAAAASVVTNGLLCGSSSVNFVANHPFLFVVRDDRNGVILFIGHVINPVL